ncbi:MAG: response regulator [Lachnospiraceae bacterium]|nr:response regulator [Lachnospiraceae bacterium]
MATILIVDDSRTSRKILKTALEKGGFSIIGEAANGEEGYLKYKELRPDIVTMDITMPTMDGIESLSLIKRENKDARVIMITAAGQKEKMVEALKRGADEFIMKPFDEAEVLDTLNRVAEDENEEKEFNLDDMFQDGQ